MSIEFRKVENLDFAGAFEQAWIQYKSNFFKLFLTGILVSVPVFLFFINVSSGVFVTLVFQGFFFIMLAYVISNSSRGKRFNFPDIRKAGVFFIKGFIISLFLLPFMVIGFVLLVIPGVFLFSLFMFSYFFIALKEISPVDSCLESMKCGTGYRLYFFLFALIFFSAMTVIFIISEWFPPLFLLCGALLFPYFFSVIFEFYEQLENK